VDHGYLSSQEGDCGNMNALWRFVIPSFARHRLRRRCAFHRSGGAVMAGIAPYPTAGRLFMNSMRRDDVIWMVVVTAIAGEYRTANRTTR